MGETKAHRRNPSHAPDEPPNPQNATPADSPQAAPTEAAAVKTFGMPSGDPAAPTATPPPGIPSSVPDDFPPPKMSGRDRDIERKS